MTKTSLLAAAATLTLAACSTVDSPCSSLQCISENAQQPIIQQCVRDLHFYPLHRSRREAIDEKYHYPLTSSATYYELMRMGATGPSPAAWCTAYAANVSRVVMPADSVPALDGR